MRHARRLIAAVIGGAVWTVLAAASAHASMLPDPDPVGSAALTRVFREGATGTPLWEYAASAMLGVLLTLAVAGLVNSLRHPQRHPGRSKPPLHA
jgi:hypothetical protein